MLLFFQHCAELFASSEVPRGLCLLPTQFGCQLEFVTNKSQEGSQFCRGFGGIGGILRYSVDTTLNEVGCSALQLQQRRAVCSATRVLRCCLLSA